MTRDDIVTKLVARHRELRDHYGVTFQPGVVRGMYGQDQVIGELLDELETVEREEMYRRAYEADPEAIASPGPGLDSPNHVAHVGVHRAVAESVGMVSVGIEEFFAQGEYEDYYRCPGCNETELQPDHKFCPQCGVKLAWRTLDPAKLQEQYHKNCSCEVCKKKRTT